MVARIRGGRAVRVLGDSDEAEALALCARDPIASVFVTGRLEATGLDPWRLGAEVWGYTPADGELTSLCFVGANLVPVGIASADEPAVRAFADRAKRQGRRASTFVGSAPAVLGLWAHLEPFWGPAREVRADQPLLAMDGDPWVTPDPGVRAVRPDEIDVLFPASVAMSTEELGVSPTAHDGGLLYRARVAELIEGRRAYARIEDGKVVFKAEIGAVGGGVCQVQGVWVDPSVRGQGVGAAGMAAVVALARREIAPMVSLYVNGYNQPARRVYEKVGFRPAGTFASVLF